MVEPLRIIDFGRSSPLRSQTLWHAIAYGVSARKKATLSSLAPVPRMSASATTGGSTRWTATTASITGSPSCDACWVVALSTWTRISCSSRSACRQEPCRLPAGRRCTCCSEPAVTAFRAVGVPAGLDADLEICVGDRKICGHGAARIEDAVVVCGNLIERFDHERAVRVLAFADTFQRHQTLALMRRFVSPTAVEPAVFQAAIISAYATALGLDPQAGRLSGAERSVLVGLDERFMSDAWLAGPSRPANPRAGQPSARQVKVRAGVWTLGATYDGAHVAAGVVRGIIDQVRLQDRGLNGSADRVEQALTGIPLQSVARVLDGFGDPGRRLAAAFAMADPARL